MQTITPAVHPAETGPASRTAPPLPWWRGWGPLVLLPGIVLLTTPLAMPCWALMWSLAFALFCGCKWLSWRRTVVSGVSLWRHLGFLLGWPGLDAAAFLNPRKSSPEPAAREWLVAAGKLLLGLGLLFGVARFIPARLPYLTGWAGMVGLVLTLHFGCFHLLSCGWRAVGVEARPLMNRPLAATGVSDFWSRRWNMAFRDLTHHFLFRPCTAWLGPRRAVLAGFLVSGLVHELVISVPAGGGYGGPTLYFVLQGLAVLVERSRFGRRMGLGRGWGGRLFALVILLAPVVVLFPPAFVLGVVVPFLRAVEAIG